MQNIVKREIQKFIEDENGLTGNEWKYNFFAPTKGDAQHVSEVRYEELSDEDMLRFLMYLLLERDRASQQRLREMNTSGRVYDDPVDKEDDLMSLEAFYEAVKDGYITDDDGSGYWVKDGLACRGEVFSSEPEDATHVVWYNK